MAEVTKRLYRSRKDRMLAGVCGGLASYIGVDPTIVRLIFVISVFVTFTTSLFLYLIFWLIIPEEPVTGVVDVVDVVDVPSSPKEE
jgi:phage shock protein C